MSIDTVGNWLRDYQVYDFAGKCSFEYKDELDFTVEVSADQSCLFLSATLLQLPQADNEPLLLRLLQLNYMGIGTQGTCLSIDNPGRNIVLWYSRPIRELDAERFGNLIGSFLDTAEAIVQRIEQQTDHRDTSDSPPETFNPDRMIRI